MISVLKILFGDLGEAMVWYEEVTENLSGSEQFGAGTTFLFNNTNTSGDSDGSLLGQHILNKYPGWKQEVPKLLKSWCLFSYREFYRNLLVLLGEVSERIYGSKTHIPGNLLGMFGLDDENVHAHMNRWTSSDISGHGFSYSAVIASKKITVQPESRRPKQFKLEKLESMTTITATVGKGCDTPEASNYSSADNDDTIDPMENLMTTLHSFEEANIIHFTMKRIKVTTNEK